MAQFFTIAKSLFSIDGMAHENSWIAFCSEANSHQSKTRYLVMTVSDDVISVKNRVISRLIPRVKSSREGCLSNYTQMYGETV